MLHSLASPPLSIWVLARRNKLVRDKTDVVKDMISDRCTIFRSDLIFFFIYYNCICICTYTTKQQKHDNSRKEGRCVSEIKKPWHVSCESPGCCAALICTGNLCQLELVTLYCRSMHLTQRAACTWTFMQHLCSIMPVHLVFWVFFFFFNGLQVKSLNKLQ